MSGRIAIAPSKWCDAGGRQAKLAETGQDVTFSAALLIRNKVHM
jgi:hypothetical protein